ncbi:hypothetical protein P4O66_012425 [Electrophorus voltai]|uniref:Uncharacterized protein n=1 Tax=Electrophorus voltai TaxID=2609070 RepID=A0AAD8Z4Q9_9TELE|nr:hypothetical protein P4O66_012425 [Electrophorus voltai]
MKGAEPCMGAGMKETPHSRAGDREAEIRVVQGGDKQPSRKRLRVRASPKGGVRTEIIEKITVQELGEGSPDWVELWEGSPDRQQHYGGRAPAPKTPCPTSSPYATPPSTLPGLSRAVPRLFQLVTHSGRRSERSPYCLRMSPFFTPVRWLEVPLSRDQGPFITLLSASVPPLTHRPSRRLKYCHAITPASRVAAGKLYYLSCKSTDAAITMGMVLLNEAATSKGDVGKRRIVFCAHDFSATGEHTRSLKTALTSFVPPVSCTPSVRAPPGQGKGGYTPPDRERGRERRVEARRMTRCKPSCEQPWSHHRHVIVRRSEGAHSVSLWER